MFDFDKEISRVGTGSIKWERQEGFGVSTGLVPFWIADTDFATVPEVVPAIQAYLETGMVGYSRESESCRQAVCGWLRRRHALYLEPDNLFLATGVVTAIKYSITALTQPGDKIMVLTPVYNPFFAIIESAGRQLVEVPLLYADNYYTMDYGRIEQELKGGAKAIIMCNPHNPVGRVWTKPELSILADLCAKYSAYMLSDEIHSDILLPGHTFISMGRFPQIAHLTVLYTAISKTFNLAGLSASQVMSHDKALLQKVRDELDSSWIFGPNALAYPAIEAAYTHGDSWTDAQNAYLAANRKLVEDFFRDKHPEIQVTRQEGTYLMWLNFGALGQNSKDISGTLAREYQVAITSGSVYRGNGDQFLRLNIGCTQKTLELGLLAMDQFLSVF